MPNTNDVYGQVAAEGAKIIWQAAGSFLTQVGILFTASKVGSISNKLMGNSTATTPASPPQTSRFNPLRYIGTKMPSMLSWFTAEAVVDEYKDTLSKPWQKLAPVGEKFIARGVEKVVTPFLDFLQNKGFMQIPQPVVEKVCDVCEVCPDLRQMVTETVKQAAMPEETGSASLISTLWERLNQPIISFGSQATEIIQDNLPSKMEQVFSTPLPEAVKSFQETINVTQPVIAQVKEAAKHIPTGYIAKAGEYAEFAGHFMAETFSTALDLTDKAIHKPAQIVHSVVPASRYAIETASSVYNKASKVIDKSAHLIHAVDDAAGIIADAMGIHRAWIIGAGIGITGLATYGLVSSVCSTSIASSQSNAAANGGAATGNVTNNYFGFSPTTALPPTTTTSSTATPPGSPKP